MLNNTIGTGALEMSISPPNTEAGARLAERNACLLRGARASASLKRALAFTFLIATKTRRRKVFGIINIVH